MNLQNLSPDQITKVLKYLSPQEREEIEELLFLETQEAYQKSLKEFLKFTFRVINPTTPFLDNWHIDLMCEYLEACARGEIKRLLINIPPRYLKSITASVSFPAWLLGNDPSRRIMCASYSQRLSLKHSTDCRAIMENEFYRKIFPKTIIAADQNEKAKFVTTEKGYRLATSTGGVTTGEGGNFLIFDDLHEAMAAQSDVIRQSDLDWFDMSYSTRLDNKKDGVIIGIGQRLHGADITAHLIAMGYTLLKIPVEALDTINYKTPVKTYSFKKGSLLHPDREDHKEIDKLKIQLGTYGFSGQYMQDPAPSGGGIIKREWFRLWEGELPRLLYIVQSYDTAFTEKTQGDPTACTTWGVFNINKDDRGTPDYRVLLLDCWVENIAFPELRQKVMKEYKFQYGINDKKVDIVLIEEKGSGISLIQELRLAGIPAREYNPGRASKTQRAHIASPIIEAGKVYLPESEKTLGKPRTWVEPFLKEICSFPVAPHDDMADSCFQALILLEHQEFIELDSVKSNDPDEEFYTKRMEVNPYD